MEAQNRPFPRSHPHKLKLANTVPLIKRDEACRIRKFYGVHELDARSGYCFEFDSSGLFETFSHPVCPVKNEPYFRKSGILMKAEYSR
jgi:hypothetical protein